jgi:GNAT superfamily N-acetyltransferase
VSREAVKDRLKGGPRFLTVRVAQADDAGQVRNLLCASYPALLKASYDAAVLAAALPEITRPNPVLLASGQFYVAQTQIERLIACGGWSFERPGTGDIVSGVAHIRHFATHPGWLRQGVGRMIYARCENAALLEGVREFECFSALNAVCFYEALGFETCSIVDLPLAQGASIAATMMKKRF